MKTKNPEISTSVFTAYILAGGKSSRMGTDKGLMMFEGEPMIKRIIDRLQQVVEKVVVISDNPFYKDFDVEVIGDVIRNIGPAGGIYSAMHHEPERSFFIVSCDMPFITPAAVRYVISEGSGSPIALPFFQNQWQPLFGLYSGSCIEEWGALINNGYTKLKEMVTHFNVKKLQVDDEPVFNDRLFTNINDKRDLENALKFSYHES